MKIDEDHLYHGAALIQIAEHPQFTSINSFTIRDDVIHNVFRINDSIAVFLKYASKPKGKYKEYAFTFNQEHLNQLARIDEVASTLVLGLVCVGGREICALPYAQFISLVERRRKDKGFDEDQYVVLLTIPKDSAFRAYVNPCATKGKMLGKEIKIARNRFPNALFE